MKAILVAALFSLGATGTLSAAALIDVGGGFAYAPVGNGQCQILLDAKNGQPIVEVRKNEPSNKVIVIGTSKECPKGYDNYRINRLVSGQESGFIYTGFYDNGRRLYIYRKSGSNFTFRYGPNPKK